MKIATTGYYGKNSRLGNVSEALVRKGAVPLMCDIRSADDVRSAIEKVAPDIIINPASKSSVNWCEENEKEAFSVNVKGAYILSSIAGEMGIPVVAMSTDYVFDGWWGPYKESYRRFNPKNGYGFTKFEMEIALSDFNNVKIVRTSNLFHRHDPRVTWYLDEAFRVSKVAVPVFQKRSFMHIDHFAKSMLYYVENFDRMPKIVNIAGSKSVTWYDFVLAFADALEFPFKHKFVRKWFDSKKYVPRPKRAGLKTSLGAKLGIPQFDYLDGMELIYD